MHPLKNSKSRFLNIPSKLQNESLKALQIQRNPSLAVFQAPPFPAPRLRSPNSSPKNPHMNYSETKTFLIDSGTR